MKASEAKTFEGYSTTHAAILTMAAQANGCNCEPYVDWFTYARWNAQGYQVQKGERGVQLYVFRTIEEKDKDTGKVRKSSRPWRSYVFCKCQVKEKGGQA